MNKIYWLFCTVIDNFGDIGVSWRLAKELRTRLNGEIYLFLDDKMALQTIAPDFLAEAHITVLDWREGEWADCHHAPLPDVVIEMFACHLPDDVLAMMAQTKPFWLNWEYLSAEDWAVRSHGMQSLQGNGATKFFWQMGFVAQSGGLLRESHLPEAKLPELTHLSEWNILIFGYASDVWAKWLRTWHDSGRKITLNLAGGKVWQSLKLADLGLCTENGQCVWDNLTIRTIDFVPQSQFDDLLAQYDLLIIRGEDSFVRAQFSGKPFFWHIYPQDELAHLDKLDAFWDKVWTNHSSAWQSAHRQLSHELNGAITLSDTERLAHWQTLFSEWKNWQMDTWHWQQNLRNQQDTVSQLAQWLAHHDAHLTK